MKAERRRLETAEVPLYDGRGLPPETTQKKR